MSLITVLAGQSQPITQSGTDTVAFVAAGTLNVTGTAANPIDVTLGSVTGVGLSDTINLTYATVHLGGSVGATALGSYNIGQGSTLDITPSVGLSAGTAFNFTGQSGQLKTEPGVNLSLLSALGGFGPGKSIDLGGTQVASVTYTDAAGTNTGGTLTLLSSNNSVIGTVTLTTGNFVTSNFDVRSDGNGGTLISFASAVTGVTATPANVLLGLGGTASITVSMSDPIAITGTPSLTLNDGGTAVYDAAASTSTQLIFRYTTAAGQNTPDLTVTGISLNGATVGSIGGGYVNFAGLATNPAGTLAVDTIAPIATAVALSQPNGAIHAGNTVNVLVMTSEPVFITGGVPTLTLSGGGTAVFDANASTATNLVFTYTVQSGQNTPDLAVTGVALNGASIVDAAGNAFNLASFVGNPAGTLVVDTIAPTIGSVTTTPGSGVLGVGGAVTFTATLSEAVTFTGGTPSLQLNDGGIATYDAASSTPTQLVFRTTIAAGQNAADLAVTGVNANGAMGTDAAGNMLSLSGLIGNPPGTLVVDTAPPVLTSLTTNPGSGVVGVGATVVFTAALSEAVTLAGGPLSLQLNDGGTATFDAASSTPTQLVFRTTIAAGQSAADLAVTGVTLNGATALDAAGNALDLSSLAVNPAGTLQVNTTAPVLSSMTTNPGSGVVGAGATVVFTAALSAGVTLTGGPPSLQLNDGGTAVFDSVSSTPTQLVFRTTIAAGQNAADLAVTSVNLNGATAVDAFGNALDLNSLAVNPAGILQVNTTAPMLSSMTTNPGSGVVGVGSTVVFTAALSEGVTLTGGPPSLQLNDGGTAIFDSASSTPTQLVFRTTIAAGQNAADLAVTAVNLNGTTAVDAGGNALNLNSLAVNPAGTLVVDTTAPIAISVAGSPNTGNVGVGQTITISVALSEPVSVSGTPTLTLSDGGTAIFDATNSTPTNLVFVTTVQPGQNAATLSITGANQNGATVTDPAGNALVLGSLVGTTVGSLSIDTTAPTVTALAGSPNTGAAGIGQTITISVSLSEPVSVSGTPTLTLNDGGTASYDAAHSTATNLVFTTTVQPGQNAANLAITAANQNGATLNDAAGNALSLGALVGFNVGSLAVDTTPPTVVTVTTNPGSGTVGAGQLVQFQVTLSEAVTIAGNLPTLALSDGGTATLNVANSTPTMLVFDHTIVAGQNSADLAITGVNVAGSNIRDSAANLLDLSGAIVNPAGVLVVNTTSGQPSSPGSAPVVTNVSTTPGSGTVATGDTVTIVLTIDHAVSVTGGVPTLALSDGGIAVFDPTRSTGTSLVFENVVQPGETAADLAIVGYTLNGASIADANGNPLSLVAAQVNPAGILSVTAQTNSGTPTVGTPTNGTSTTVSGDGTGTVLIYRFFETSNGTHFYTANAGERDQILSTRPDLVFEGTGLRAVSPSSNDAAAIAVYRFFDKTNGTQFLTASASERDNVIATRSDLTFEPDGTFYEHIQPQAGDTAVYRFFSSTDGTHFYTDSAAERATILQTRPDLVDEGIGFYEPR